MIPLLPTMFATIAAVVAPAEASLPEQVTVEVDHAGLLEQQMQLAADSTAIIVQRACSETVQAQGVKVVEDADAPALVVKLGWTNYADSVYRIEILTRRPGQDPESFGAFDYQTGTTRELNAFIAERIPAALEQLAEEPEQAAEDGPPTPPVGEDAVQAEPQPQEPETRPRAPLGALGKAGIGIGATGAVGLVVGGIVFAQGRSVTDGPEPRLFAGNDFRQPGIAVMVSGGVLLAAGVTMLVVDRVRAKRRPAKDASQVRWAPSPAGLVVRW